ncbi:MAG: MFS transporter [Bacteroidales bacterium]
MKKNISTSINQLLNPQQKKMYYFLMLLIVAATIGLQGWRTLFNNFAVDNLGINGFQVGAIQSVRELPGFLTFLMVFILLIVKEHKLSIYSLLICGASVILTGFFPSFWGLFFTTFLMSTGYHFFEATNRSLTLQYFDKRQSPIILGKQQSWKAVINIIIGIIILFTSTLVDIKWNFVLIGVLVIILALFSLRLNPVDKSLPPQKTKMVVKKKYWLFYVINFLSGARRQIFQVFAVFMLVEQYHFGIEKITALFILNNIITFFVAPIIAKSINRFGEHPVLTMEYGMMVLVFLGYAFIKNGWIIAAFYIIDNIFYTCAMGINTFFQKIGKPEDIAPSMSFGFAINHTSAVIIPVIGGLLWIYNYKIPFLLGVILSIASLILVQLIPSQIRKADKEAILTE